MIEPDLSGHTALVTGSGRGVGRELLLAIAERGARVAVHYRTSDETAREVAAETEERGAPEVTVVRGDVTEPDEVDALFGDIESDLGTVDVLVNNVGTFAPMRWDEMSYATWRNVIQTNVDGTYLCCRRALPGMKDAGWGRIVNIGYASAEKGMVSPRNTPYFMAKAGVLMFTRMLAADTQHDGITVNAVSPYVVENSDVFPEQLPRDRPASFEDMSQAVLFFLEPDSDYLSGANVEVHGGWLPEEV